MTNTQTRGEPASLCEYFPPWGERGRMEGRLRDGDNVHRVSLISVKKPPLPL